MAANIPKVAPSARHLLLRASSTRRANPISRTSLGRPQYLPSLASQIRSYAVERGPIEESLKLSLTDDEVIAASSQVGVKIRTPEDLTAAQGVFKSVMAVATLEEAGLLFDYYEKNGDFPLDVKKALQARLSEALAAKPTAADIDAHRHQDAGHGHGAAAHGTASSSESFGIGWWLALGGIPFSYILYLLTRSKTFDGDVEQKPFLTRWMHSYDEWQDEWRRRNERNTMAVTQAGMDKLLFNHSDKSIGSGIGKHTVRDTEWLNVGPPMNVAAGQGSIDLDKVIAHYHKVNEETEKERERLDAYFKSKPRGFVSA